SMNAIWCTMNATCAISANANGPDTVQNGRLRSASRRVQAGAADGAGAGAEASEGTQSTTAGTRIATITAAAISIAEVNPSAPISATSVGATTMPPKLAPLSASEIARPRLRVNHWLISVGITTRPSPSQPNDIIRYAA